MNIENLGNSDLYPKRKHFLDVYLNKTKLQGNKIIVGF